MQLECCKICKLSSGRPTVFGSTASLMSLSPSIFVRHLSCAVSVGELLHAVAALALENSDNLQTLPSCAVSSSWSARISRFVDQMGLSRIAAQPNMCIDFLAIDAKALVDVQLLSRGRLWRYKDCTVWTDSTTLATANLACAILHVGAA